jgi:hypothetical protein
VILSTVERIFRSGKRSIWILAALIPVGVNIIPVAADLIPVAADLIPVETVIILVGFLSLILIIG